MSLPGSVRKGVADGIYGRETIEAVKRFQRSNGLLLVDGFAGRETIVLLDDTLAQEAGMSWPIPAGPPSSPSDPDYEIGSGDPPLHHDPGAGVWNSKPAEASYVALKLSILEILPEAAVVVGIDAARHMAHYLRNTGKDLTINLEGMVKDVPSAQVRYRDEVAEVQSFVETVPPGTNPIRSKMVEQKCNKKSENANWYFAIGGYSTWGRGTATVAGDPSNRTYSDDFEYKFYDRYNWDAGKSVTFHSITVTDKFMGEFHRQGLAQEFECFGSFKRKFSWKKGDAIPPGQMDGPGARS
jgi:hypothetical protein